MQCIQCNQYQGRPYLKGMCDRCYQAFIQKRCCICLAFLRNNCCLNTTCSLYNPNGYHDPSVNPQHNFSHEVDHAQPTLHNNPNHFTSSYQPSSGYQHNVSSSVQTSVFHYQPYPNMPDTGFEDMQAIPSIKICRHCKHFINNTLRENFCEKCGKKDP